MYPRNLSKLLTRQRHAIAQGRSFTAEAHTAMAHKFAREKCQAPPSIAAIPADASEKIGNAGASIRPIGCSRRVFLMNPYLTPDEIEGLAYRIRVLNNNEFLNSVLIATDETDPRETDALPAMLLDQDEFKDKAAYDPPIYDPKPGKIFHVAGGYDPKEWFKSGKHKDSAAVASLLDSVSDLAKATRGGDWSSRVPVISIPHGAVTDGGYALCLGTYVIATEQTHFRIQNPSRGLTFDPVGFSFILPRLGEEFEQPSAPYKGCGQILALMGYEANPEDMMETGLATHYMDSPGSYMGMLERTLSQLPPWNQQRYVKTRTLTEAERQRLFYDSPEESNRNDPHRIERNVALADTIYAFTSYAANGKSCWSDEVDEDTLFPAAFDLDNIPWSLDRESELVNLAYSFDSIFQREATVEGLLESFREIAGRRSNDPEEQDGSAVAADFVRRIEEQAPLALRVTHKLMKLGEGKHETLSSCMRREKSAQAKLMNMPDFESWGKAQLSIASSKSIPAWQHRTLADVTEDEVSEIIGLDVESPES